MIHSDDMAKIKNLASSAPYQLEATGINWETFEEGMNKAPFPSPEAAMVVTWCTFGKINIEALVDAPLLAVVGYTGIYASAGKTALLSSKPKFETIDWRQVESFGPEDYEGDGHGKFTIGFAGPGGVFLGRLAWTWRAKRFQGQRNREVVMASASERNRVLNAVSRVLS